MFNIDEKILRYLKSKKVKNEPVATLTSEEVTETEPKETKTETSNKKKEELINILKESNEELKGKDKNADKVTLEKIDYTPLTNEQIEELAGREAEGEYALKKNALDKTTDEKRAEIERNTQQVKEGVGARKEKIDSAYNLVKNEVENQAIKRGISRSSIVAEQIKGLEVEKIKDYLSVDNEVASELKKYSNELEDLERNYNYAVQNLDIEKAISVREKIEELTEKQNKAIENAIEHNNKVDKDQLYIDDKYYGGVPNGDGSSKTELEIANIRQKMLTSAMEYYLAMPKEERLKELEGDEEIKKLLGGLYDTLYRYAKYTE